MAIAYGVCVLAGRARPAEIQATAETVTSPVTQPVAPRQPTPIPVTPVAAAVCSVPTVLEGVRFDSDQGSITVASEPILNRVAKRLRSCRDQRVRIEAHTDSSGSAPYNLDLSRRRAESVRNFLVLQGINARRLELEGLGETRPVADNDTPSGRALNRRVEIHPIFDR